MCLGYEDLVDHDQLRHDPLLGALLGRLATSLSGKSTLNRLEHAPSGEHRYRKISHDPKAIENLLVELFLNDRRKPSAGASGKPEAVPTEGGSGQGAAIGDRAALCDPLACRWRAPADLKP